MVPSRSPTLPNRTSVKMFLVGKSHTGGAKILLHELLNSCPNKNNIVFIIFPGKQSLSNSRKTTRRTIGKMKVIKVTNAEISTLLPSLLQRSIYVLPNYSDRCLHFLLADQSWLLLIFTYRKTLIL